MECKVLDKVYCLRYIRYSCTAAVHPVQVWFDLQYIRYRQYRQYNAGTSGTTEVQVYCLMVQAVQVRYNMVQAVQDGTIRYIACVPSGHVLMVPMDTLSEP